MRVREISDDEGDRLKRIVRRGSGSVVTWRRAHNFNADGFESLYPCYAGGRPPVFTLAQPLPHRDDGHLSRF